MSKIRVAVIDAYITIATLFVSLSLFALCKRRFDKPQLQFAAEAQGWTYHICRLG